MLQSGAEEPFGRSNTGSYLVLRPSEALLDGRLFLFQAAAAAGLELLKARRRYVHVEPVDPRRLLESPVANNKDSQRASLCEGRT